MGAIIRKVCCDGEFIYQVEENHRVEYTTGDIQCAEKYCENNYGTDWGEE